MATYNIGKYFVDLPADHKLPVYQRDEPLYDRGFIPLLLALFKSSPSGWIVDIGANVGDTASLMASLTGHPIICVEGEEAFLPFLRRNLERLSSEIVLCERHVFTRRIEELGLTYHLGDSTGGFSTGEGKQAQNFVTIDEIVKTAAQDVLLFKSDTDGLDIPIVEEFLDRGNCPDAVIFMEVNPNYQVTDLTYVAKFFRRIAEANYSLAIFSNRGVPFGFMDRIEPDLLVDMLRHVVFSQGGSAVPYHYLDFFLFPKSRQAVFSTIVRGYRDGSFM
jgi:FkbM family methyltransferase